MKQITPQLKREEQAVFALRALYRQYGYTQYKMSKFEEYDLYSRNKEFLISDSVITFTDTNGKLMALKPDVTLSIIKNGQDGVAQKVYYDEHVYRVSGSTHSFKEIMQVGLERIGTIDTYALYEVLLLAAESLRAVAEDCVLNISHLGIVSSLLERLPLSAEDMRKAWQCMADKNGHELAALCADAGIEAREIAPLRELMAVYGKPADVFPRLTALLDGTAAAPMLAQLREVVDALDDSSVAPLLRIDFSVVNDQNYYNGIAFKGFVNGIATGILSGGQYDRLMKKMGRHAGAIGFALYLDLLEELPAAPPVYDIDTVLLYDDTAKTDTLRRVVARLINEGAAVTAVRAVPDKVTYRQLLKLTGEEVEVFENHA